MYWEEDVPLKDLRKRLLKWSWWIGLFLFILIIVLACVLKFPDQIELPFVLKRDQAESIFRYPYPVYVLDVKVSSGQTVHPGMDLIKITSPEIVVLINNLREAEQNFKNFGQQKIIVNEKQLSIVARQKQQNNLRISEMRNQLSILNSQWESNKSLLEYEYNDASAKMESFRKLFESKDISKFEWNELENKKIRAKDALQQAIKQYENEKGRLLSSIENESLSARSEDDELSRLKADSKYDSTFYFNRLELARNNIRHVFGEYEIQDGGLMLKAESEATVSYLFEGEKEVPDGVILMKLIQGENSVYSSVSCPPSFIGKIKAGQDVYLKIASFPFYEWGSVKSKIHNLSLSPDEKGNFNLNIRIEDPGNLKGLLQSGMNGNAIIILDEKSIMEYFFRNVKKVYYSSLGSD
jgi:hypothetical protein